MFGLNIYGWEPGAEECSPLQAPSAMSVGTRDGLAAATRGPCVSGLDEGWEEESCILYPAVFYA